MLLQKPIEWQQFGMRRCAFDIGQEGNDLVRASLDATYDRLARLKAGYDPDNFFRRNHNILPRAISGSSGVQLTDAPPDNPGPGRVNAAAATYGAAESPGGEHRDEPRPAEPIESV